MKLIFTIKNLFLMFSLLCLSQMAQAQTIQVTPATTPPFTPVNLIEQIFLGDGVEVLNITYTGDPQAVGYFKLGQQDVGMYDGVVMTTGNAALIPIANNTQTNSGAANNGGADVDLTTIAGSGTFNAAIYTIDFIPSSDTLRFNYVFASEEYTDFVCQFNDVFGFFISGPGIVGPYQNMAQNIALLPNSNVPVAVGTINGGVSTGSANPCILTNTQYYVDNDWVTAPGQSNHQIIYDGFTTVLTAEAIVQPCSTYRIKLAIADAIDQAYDSGVFLQANSFGTNGLRVFSETPSLTNSVAEGCEPATINFELDNPADNNYNLSYSLGGSAVYGVDYDSIPLSAVIPQGQSSYQLQLHALPDNIVEGVDTIEVYINVTPCDVDTFFIYIEDAILQTPSISDTIICLGDTANFDLSNSITLIPPTGSTFVNDTLKPVPFGSPVSSYYNVSGVPMFNVQQGTIDSVCIDINHIWGDDLDVYLISPNGQFLELTTDNGGLTSYYSGTCFTPTATTAIAGLGVAASPFTGEFQPEGNWSDLYGSPVNGQWQLRVIDDKVGFDGDLVRWSISFAAPYDYQYAWTPPDTTSLSCLDCPVIQAFPDTTTTYTITMLDSYGCTSVDSATVTVTDVLPPPSSSCHSSTTNTITISWNPVANATGYQINVDGAGFTPVTAGDTSFTATGLSPNQTVLFELSVEGGICFPNGIDTIQCSTLPCSMIAIVTDTVAASCNGYSDGSAIVAASNGFGDYFFAIDGNVPQQNDGSFSGLLPGLHEVIVTDDDMCADTVSFIINQPAGMTITLTNTITSCFDGSDGTASVSVTGGTPAYTYQWSTIPPQITPTATGLSAGMHYITITDANNCSQIDSTLITEPTAVTTAMTGTIVSCFGGSDGTATVAPNGGTPAYTYQWSTTPIQNTPTATMLSAGQYYVTVTDANNCFTVDSIIITQQPGMTLSSTSTLVSCSGGSDGTATVNATGGAGSYTYAWAVIPVQTTQTATNLISGIHYVTVTDANGCPATDTVTVGTSNPIIISVSSTPAACLGVSDGTVTASATGGAGGYSFAWNTVPPQSTATATALAAGTYIVTITDANSCFDTASVTVGVATALTGNIVGVDVSCFGGSDGSATVTVGSGTIPYSYNWSLAGAPNNNMINNIMAGTYSVTTTDASGCLRTDNVIISQPNVVTTATTTISVSCSGGGDGSAGVNISGGTMPFSYSWSTTPPQTGSSATNLVTGKYYVTVTDANNCSYIDSATVLEPAPLTLATGMVPISCFGGSDGKAWVTITGGTAPYVSAWNTTPISPGDTLSNASEGSYTVTVTDANNCSAAITVSITQPAAALTTTTTFTNVSCNNGSNGTGTILPVGGSGGYNYNWSNNSFSQTATNLQAGSYTAIVTDVNGCVDTNSVVITEPTALTMTLSQQASGCFGSSDGIAIVSASGGVPNAAGDYTYSWNSNPVQNNDTAFALTGGQTYTISITDSNNCVLTDSITITNPVPITVNIDVTNVPCFGYSTGTATATPSGGSPNYTYQWDANAGDQTTATATGLGVGSYTVTVTDAGGCQATQTAMIIEPNPMSSTTLSFAVACKGDASGTASIQVSGGSPGQMGYTYQWDTNAGNQTSNIATNLLAGQYFISVTDSVGCILLDSVEILEPALDLGVSFAISNVTCNDGNDGNIRIFAVGGTPAYEYSFDSINYNTSNIVAGLSAGLYRLYIRDAKGCTHSDTFSISEPPVFDVDLGDDISIVLSEDTTLIPIITNGVMPFSFSWSPTDSLTCLTCETPQAVGLQLPMHYYLTVTDATGCTTTDDIFINVLTPRIVYVATGFSPNNDNINERLFVQGDFNTARVVSFQVYDRWGEKIFENYDTPLNDPEYGWDGRFKGQMMPPAVYGWVTEVEFADGERMVYKGNTSLIR